jgi:hypothetical protein
MDLLRKKSIREERARVLFKWEEDGNVNLEVSISRRQEGFTGESEM